VQRFREMAFVTRKVQIRLVDERHEPRNDLLLRRRHHLVCALPQPQPQGLHPVMYVEKEIEGIGVEAAIQYTDAYSESVYRLPTRSTPSTAART
jgi:DNA gyrase subunit B